MNKNVAAAVVATVLISFLGFSWRLSKINKENVPNITVERGEAMSSVVKTPSGLKYQIVVDAPEGAISPKKGGVAQVHYTGWLADENDEPILSKKFDSSVDRKQPFAFRVGVGMVIAGWDEGVLGMKVGEERRLIIPSHLGYGAQGAGNSIPANSTLVFDVKLLNVS